MLAWEKSYWTWNPKQSYLKSGICLDSRGLDEYMLFMSQATALNIWLVKMSAFKQGVYSCFFWSEACGFLIIWAFISHMQHIVLHTCFCGKIWGRKAHRLLRDVCEKYWEMPSFVPKKSPTNTTEKGKARSKNRLCYDWKLNKKFIVS